MNRYDKLKRVSKRVSNTNTEQADTGGYRDKSTWGAPVRLDVKGTTKANGTTVYKHSKGASEHKAGRDGNDMLKRVNGSTQFGKRRSTAWEDTDSYKAKSIRRRLGGSGN